MHDPSAFLHIPGRNRPIRSVTASVGKALFRTPLSRTTGGGFGRIGDARMLP